VHGYKNVDFSTFVLMMTEAISRNIGEIFFLILSWYSENSLSIHVLAYPNHYTKLTVMRACVHACVSGGQWKLFDPESNTGSSLG